jgi:hypothetical protein
MFEVTSQATRRTLARAANTAHLQKNQPHRLSCDPTSFSAYLAYDETGILVG